MAKRRTKYTMRSDGRIVKTKVYPNGQKKYFYGSTDKEVEAKEAAYDKEYEAAQLIHCRTVKQVVNDYWRKQESKISPSSVIAYEIYCQRIIDAWGERYIDDVSVQDIYQFLDRFSIKGYASKTIRNIRTVVNKVFDEAIIAGEISHNPVDDVPTVSGKPKKKRPPASDKDIAIVDAHKNDNIYTRMCYFSLVTGLRRGEMAALQFKDIDRQGKTLTVERSCAWGRDGKPVIKSPKTDAGTRVVSLVDAALSILPSDGKPEDYVFFPDGLPTKGEIGHHLENARKKLGVTSTPHQYRHSFATLGHSAGIDPKDMQTELGHSTLEMTMDIYTDVDSKQRERVRKKLNNYINKNPFTPVGKK